MPTRLIQRGEHYSLSTEFKPGQPSWNKGLKRSGMSGKHHSEATKKKMRLSSSGSRASNWKGGISPLNKIIRRSLQYRIWRELVFKRDNYTCIWCNKRGGELHPDHIKPFSLFPELRFDINNGRTLCIECHKQTDTYGGKVRVYFN